MSVQERLSNGSLTHEQFVGLLAGLAALEREELAVDTEEAPRLTEQDKETQTELRRELFRTGSAFKPTSRDEIVGIDNVLGEIDEIIHWLRHADQYSEHDSRLQPGVVFSGKPGTGKTLVSRWIATASGALFINVRDFVHRGALFTDADIRELFKLARQTHEDTGKPVVLFWDEFESCAVERSDGTPEQQSVVSQLTAELDGIHGKNQGILLIGCTNYFTSIDSALTRRGRMGVHIEFHSPDRAGKEKILAFYLGKMNTTPDIEIDTLSYFFPKHNTAADIEEACVEAWRHAVRRAIDSGGNPCLAQDDLVQVFIKQLVGPPTTFTLPEDERMPIAIHESGHAIVALTYGVPLRLITVQPGKKSLGRVMVDDLKEYIGTVPETINYMKMTLGGMAAEHTAGLPPMTGAGGDILRVNETAEYLVTQLAAGKRTNLLNVSALTRQCGYYPIAPQISENVVADLDYDVRYLLTNVEEDAYWATERVGRENLYKIAETVNERVTMTGTQFRALYETVCGFAPERVG